MPYSIEDGKGSRSEALVFENRIKALATECSLINHLSSKASEQSTTTSFVEGVYESRAVSSVAGSGSSLIYLVNTDPDKIVVIDRIFTNGIVSATPLPDTSTFVQVLMGRALTAGTGTSIIVNNLNQSIINIQPNLTILNGATTSGGVENLRRYVNLGRVYQQEVLTQKEDGILLGNGNSMEIFLSTLSSTTIEVSMRFAIADPDDLEIR